MCGLFPNSEVFTLFDFLPEEIKEEFFHGVRFHTSFANRLPFVEKYYRALFFLGPFLIEQFDVTDYDLVISSSAAFSRGVLTRPDQPHLCYVHSPVRYAWDEQFSYLQQGRLGFGPKGMLFRYMLHNLRMWDTRTAHGPSMMIANSSYVRSRIRNIYGRNAEVIHPPVACQEFECVTEKDDYYVSASFLAPYKRTDLVVQAFTEMPDKRLVVVGSGPQLKELQAMAGPNVEFAGHLSRRDYIRTLSHARAMVFAGCEDFGIALAEAQAGGTPLLAFGRGGARDIVRPLGKSEDPTGILFDTQSVDAVKDVVARFERDSGMIRPEACTLNAGRFSEQRFDQAVLRSVGAVQATFSDF
ncbi:glycosyltransferase [Oricola thermophila]|uniref:Glycosyltransferase n=2 Tax=Oricola thermophila TaxID=2742145 RepID=A0A6N1VMX1_9HYPH|nr:glycosyltransferase [Oricola thermophila]